MKKDISDSAKYWQNFSYDFIDLSIIDVKLTNMDIIDYDDLKHIKKIDNLPFNILSNLLSECYCHEADLNQEISFWENKFEEVGYGNVKFKKRSCKVNILAFKLNYFLYHIGQRFIELSHNRGLYVLSDFENMDTNKLIYERQKLYSDEFASKFIGDNEWEEWFLMTRNIADKQYFGRKFCESYDLYD